VKPLREQFDPTDPNEVCGAALLARVPPLAFSAARQQRVRFALRASRPAITALRLSPALVAGVVILAATGASAMVARYFVRAHVRAPELVSTVALSVDPAPRAAGKSRRAPAPAGEAATDPSPQEPAESAPAAVPLPDPAPKSDPLPKQPAPRSRGGSPAAATPSAASPGGALMMEVMQARRAGDMARAASLLAEYRSKYPDGDLYEEALALSIEAAVARGDDNAQRLAGQYLKRYPNGRFREQAERALKAPVR
jgi:hypothetical protein